MKSVKLVSLGGNHFFYLFDKFLLVYLKYFGGRILYNIIKKIIKLYTDKIKYNKINTAISNFNNSDQPIFKWIEIETINRCNGKCSFCPVSALQPQRPFAKMDEKLFKKIIDELCELNYKGNCLLFSNNEPFLDPRIIDFAKYAREKLPNAKLIILSNGLLLNVEKMISILPFIDNLYIDNYNDKFIMHKNISEIYKWGNKNPYFGKKITISMRLENEILSSRGGDSPNNKGKLISAKCILPFVQIVIRPTGLVSLCCNDALGKMTLGDVNKTSLIEIWNSDIYKSIRNIISTQGRNSLDLCKNCDFATIEHI